jgi:hypothetical protein
MGFDPKVYLENDLSDVVHIFLEKRIFLSIAIPKHTFPKHTSKVTM